MWGRYRGMMAPKNGGVMSIAKMLFNRHIIIIISFIFTTLTTGYFLMISAPLKQYQTIKDQKNEIMNKVLIQNKQTYNLLLLNQLRPFFRRLKAPINMPNFLTLVASLCERCLLSPQHIVPAKEVHQGQWTDSFVEMHASGDYFNVLKFINELTHMPWVISVFAIELTESPQGVELHLVIEIHHS